MMIFYFCAGLWFVQVALVVAIEVFGGWNSFRELCRLPRWHRLGAYLGGEAVVAIIYFPLSYGLFWSPKLLTTTSWLESLLFFVALLATSVVSHLLVFSGINRRLKIRRRAERQRRAQAIG